MENNRNNLYFEHQHTGIGASYLVGYSQFHLIYITKQLDKGEVELNLQVEFLTNSLGTA